MALSNVQGMQPIKTGTILWLNHAFPCSSSIYELQLTEKTTITTKWVNDQDRFPQASAFCCKLLLNMHAVYTVHNTSSITLFWGCLPLNSTTPYSSFVPYGCSAVPLHIEQPWWHLSYIHFHLYLSAREPTFSPVAAIRCSRVGKPTHCRQAFQLAYSNTQSCVRWIAVVTTGTYIAMLSPWAWNR